MRAADFMREILETPSNTTTFLRFASISLQAASSHTAPSTQYATSLSFAAESTAAASFLFKVS